MPPNMNNGATPSSGGQPRSAHDHTYSLPFNFLCDDLPQR